MLQMIAKLDQLRQHVLGMADLVEKALACSVAVLGQRDELEARRVLDYEAAIDALEIETDQVATELLALNQPVAKDLRFITAAIKINSDLERMGDLAVNIARSALTLIQSHSAVDISQVQEMAKLVEGMVHDAVTSLAQSDAELARRVLAGDTAVDELKDLMFSQLVRGIEADPTAAAAKVDLIFIAHSLERIADHATNIAEDVLFFVKGVEARHRRSSSATPEPSA